MKAYRAVCDQVAPGAILWLLLSPPHSWERSYCCPVAPLILCAVPLLTCTSCTVQPAEGSFWERCGGERQVSNSSVEK